MATFKKVLKFSEPNENGLKIAHFVDREGNNKRVETDSVHVFPNMRYLVTLEAKDKNSLRYDFVSCSVWRDKLELVFEEGKEVKILLQGEEVQNFTYNLDSESNYHTNVEDLKRCFSEKTFQMRGGENIRAFIRNYSYHCRQIRKAKLAALLVDKYTPQSVTKKSFFSFLKFKKEA